LQQSEEAKHDMPSKVQDAMPQRPVFELQMPVQHSAFAPQIRPSGLHVGKPQVLDTSSQ
jgi:hypothetical protein